MTTSAFAQEEPSRLRYAVPEGWTPSTDGRTLLPPGGNAAVTYAPSMPFAGAAEQWIEESWSGILGELKLVSGPIPGTQGAFLTRIGLFQQVDGTQVWLCLHTLVRDGRGEGVIYFAPDESLFRTHLPALSTMLAGILSKPPTGDRKPETAGTVGDTVRHDDQSANATPAAGVGATSSAASASPMGPKFAGADDVAGLHLATTRQLRINPFGGSGSADWVVRTEYYLLSPDGRVFRGRDLPAAPGGDIGRFDYEAARRQAPGNYGAYTVRGSQVLMQFPDEMVTADCPEADVLEIRGTRFRRSNASL